jgi:hypothetical protein
VILYTKQTSEIYNIEYSQALYIIVKYFFLIACYASQQISAWRPSKQLNQCRTDDEYLAFFNKLKDEIAKL